MYSADYAVARCLSVCQSVRPSVTRRYSVETVIHIIKLFPPSGSHTILVSLYQTVKQYSNKDPLTGASNTSGYEKSRFFDQYLALQMYLGNDRRNSHSYDGRQIGNQAFQMGHIFSITLNDPKPRFQGHARGMKKREYIYTTLFAKWQQYKNNKQLN